MSVSSVLAGLPRWQSALDQHTAQEGVDERHLSRQVGRKGSEVGVQLDLITLLKVTRAGSYGTRSSGRGP